MIPIALPREVRLGLLALGFLLPVALGVVLRIAGETPAPAERRGEEATPCEATRLDATCPAGQRCAAGLCLPARLGAPLLAGERCSAAQGCGLGLECHRGRCQEEGALRAIVAPLGCRPQALRRVLAALQVRCAKALGVEDAVLGDCDGSKWTAISRERGFDELMREASAGFSVFFPHAEPDARGRWPTTEARAFLLRGVEASREELRAGRIVLSYARASTVGGAEENAALAARRNDLVASLIQEALGRAPALRRWTLAATTEDSLEARRRDLRGRRLVASTEAELAELRSLPALRDEELGRRERELRDAVNRVVDVVPLPCDGHEFFPVPAFRAREEER